MKLVTIAISFILVLMGAYSNRKRSKDLTQEPSSIQREDIHGVKTEVETSTAISPVNNSDLLSEYLYPGAKIVNQDSSGLELKTSDDPEGITDWYKEKIISQGMNVKTFVSTKTNGNVLNKLLGATSEKEVRVEIEKAKDGLFATVTLSLDK